MFFKIFHYLFLFKFKYNNTSAELRVALDDVFHKFSYRITENQLNANFIYLRYLRKAIFELFKSTKTKQNVKQNTDLVIFDSSIKGKKDRESYLTGLLDYERAVWIYRESLPNEISLFHKMTYTLFLILVAGYFQLFKNKSTRKAQLALFLLESVEWLKIIKFCSKLNTRKFLFFCAYEKDANFISFYLMKELHFSVQFVPSPNPLSNFYKNVVCSVFTFTAPYQKYQYEQLKENWFVGKVITWPIFNHQQLKQLIFQYNYCTPKNTIGFMSSGNWLREELGEKELGLGERKAERELMICLKQFVDTNKNISMTVFLHPYEKRSSERVQRSIDFYKKMFGSDVQLADLKKSTIQQLDLVDIGVGVYSGVLFERLFVGFKTMFGLFNMPYNYFSDERLLKISAYSADDFHLKLYDILKMTNTEYVEKFNLKEYTSLDQEV